MNIGNGNEMVLTLKEYWKRLKDSKNREIMIFLLIFIGGQFLFLTSKNWFPNGADYRTANAIYSSKISENIKFTLIRWDYSLEEKSMEIEIGISNNSLQDNVTYEYEALTKDYSKVDMEIKAEKEDFIVVRLYKIPKKWKEMIFCIDIIKNGESGDRVKFYTNDESIKEIEKIETYSEKEYYENYLQSLISEQTKIIENYEKENKEKSKKQKDYAARILNLQKSKEFQTEDEISNTEGLINEAAKNINQLEEEKKSNVQMMKKCSEKIKKLEEKLKSQEKGQK